ncbi:MAG: hypothetical protein IPM74_12305 [Crocinitomicaceae bacterium]|nr:hypothetical protein [Crocinitomicaceae bacterium]MBK8926657.1 hypothetical protein [Crocinitomicaceae bacterium]
MIKNFLFFLFLVICVVTIWWQIGWVYVDSITIDNPEINSTSEYRGTFGDKFGFVNSLFSALALAGIIYSIFLQQRELSLQRKELNETKAEFRDQNFQTAYFNLLRMNREIVDELNVTFVRLNRNLEKKIIDAKGRSFFKHFKTELKRISDALNEPKFIEFNKESALHEMELEAEQDYYDSINSEGHTESGLVESETSYMHQFTLQHYKISEEEFNSYKKLQSEREKVVRIYDFFLRKYAFAIGHYFRHSYQTLLFLDHSEKEKIKNSSPIGEVKDLEKIREIKSEFRRYSQFFKSQMTIPEAFALFYNSFKFKNAEMLLSKYQILDFLPAELILDKRHNFRKEIILFEI